jgi:acetone carboxylase, gamma subunit
MNATRIRFTEYLDLDVDAELWRCNRCDAEIGPARQPYKQGCLVYERDPREVHPPLIEGQFTFSPDPDWVRILEFYCSGCGAQVETEYLPPGHPVTVDIELDVDRLKARLASGELTVVGDGRLAVSSGREVSL